MDKLCDFFRTDMMNYHKFRGKYIWEYGWLLYLENFFVENFFTTWKGGKNGIIYSEYKNARNQRYVMGLSYKSWFYSEIQRLIEKKYKYIVGILTIKCRCRSSHANALIFDVENKIVTRFEPHGSLINLYDFNNMDLEFKKMFENAEIRDRIGCWTYNSPSTYCNGEGPQTKENKIKYEKKTGKVYGKIRIIEPKGYCSSWSLLFIHCKLLNPQMSYKDIINNILSYDNAQLSKKIREYSSYIVNNVNENWTSEIFSFNIGDCVLFDDGINKNPEYGKIMDINPKNVQIFSININDRKIKGKKDFYLIKVPHYDIELLNDSNYIEIINNKYKNFDGKRENFNLYDYVTIDVNGNSEYGIIIKKNPKNCKVFTINYIERMKNSFIYPYVIYNTSYTSLNLLNNKDLIIKIDDKYKLYQLK